MNVIAALVAFIESPAGAAVIAVMPNLVNDVISIWHTQGVLTPQAIADYLKSQQAFDTLVPKKPAA
jgi:hypothetical protein